MQELAREKKRPRSHPRTKGKTPGKRGKGTPPTQRKQSATRQKNPKQSTKSPGEAPSGRCPAEGTRSSGSPQPARTKRSSKQSKEKNKTKKTPLLSSVSPPKACHPKTTSRGGRSNHPLLSLRDPKKNLTHKLTRAKSLKG